MFVKNSSGSALVNTAHIIALVITSPEYEQKDYWVVASLTRGTEIMHRGTKESCLEYMEDFATRENNEEQMQYKVKSNTRWGVYTF